MLELFLILGLIVGCVSYILDSSAYAGEPTPVLSVSGVRPLGDFRLWVRLNTGEAKVYDFKPLLNLPVFAPLSDPDTFKAVYGTVAWNDGEIDIAPEELYENGLPT